jgi:hypothetical protein
MVTGDDGTEGRGATGFGTENGVVGSFEAGLHNNSVIVSHASSS